MKKLPVLLSIVLVLSSCASTRVKVNTKYPNGLPVETLNLISTMIGPVKRPPPIPLIDAAAFNVRLNNISDQIMDEEQKIIENYKLILIKNLSEKLPAGLKTGSDFTSTNANRYRVENGIQIKNNNFPVVFFSEGDMNVVDFGASMNVNNTFVNNEALKPRIAKFASDLNLKNVLISYNRLCVTSVNSGGWSGYIRLESYLYLYNFNGELIMDVYGCSDPATIDVRQIDHYKIVLNMFRALTLYMSEELVKYII